MNSLGFALQVATSQSEIIQFTKTGCMELIGELKQLYDEKQLTHLVIKCYNKVYYIKTKNRYMILVKIKEGFNQYKIDDILETLKKTRRHLFL